MTNLRILGFTLPINYLGHKLYTLKYLFVILLLPSIYSTTYSQTNQQKFEGGTTILTLLSKDSVWIVADSKQGSLESQSQNRNTSIVCKINHTNGIYYTFSGQLVNSKSPNGFYYFNSNAILELAISKYKNFDSMFLYFDSTIRNKLFLACQKDSQQSIKHFKERFLNRLLLNVTITTFINGNLKFVSRKYYCSLQKSNKIEILYKDIIEPPGFPVLFKVGMRSAIDSFLKKNPNFDLSSSRIKYWGQYLVGLEIKRDSNAVGKPINIISFGHDNKPNWILKSLPCW